MTINWATALAAIAGDNTGIAIAVRAKVTAIGQLYDLSGHPDFMTESAAHIAWRADMVSQLAARDRTAASVDGLPSTTIDPANPGASRAAIASRLNAVSASGATGALIADMLATPLPDEPRQWVDAYYTRQMVGLSTPGQPSTVFQTVGDVEAALVAALAELAAYISFR